ncbi:MAG: N-acetyltransferase [Ruminococcus sp.]|nr:N-acetyltransferase [Candidatus Copronaster equi]
MIRKMNKRDWLSVSEIYNQGIESGKSTFNTTYPSYDEWDSSHHKECRLVYEENGTVYGWVAVSPTSVREAYRGVVEVSVYVDEKQRCKGIGTKLLNALKDEARKSGFWSLFTIIFATNEASLALHRKCGFREIGYRERIAQDKFGVWQNTVNMEYRL